MAFQHILLDIELILILMIISTVKFIKNDTDVWNDYFLKPLHYNVEVEFNVYTNVFNGKCSVIIEINHPTKHIAMKKPKMFDIINISLVNLENYLIINTQNLLFTNETNIYLDFTQSVTLIPGRYRLTYYYNYNNYTKFDDIHCFNPNYTIYCESTKIIRAEQLFPHWDEPKFKSTFNISIAHHINYKLLSNMPLRRKVRYVKELEWTHFDKSSLMSVQDLTIVVINTNTAIDIIQNYYTMEFWCAKEKTDQVEFARRIAEASVQYLRYITLKRRNRKEMPTIYYIVVKSIPHININVGDFLLLREKDIIYQNTSDRISDKLKVANFVAHQTTSFWFQDISLWAKEGFITFLTAHLLTEIHGMTNMMDLFVVQTQQESLRIDSLLNINSHPLHTANFPTVYSFKSPFNYTKASVIWRILNSLMSNLVFRTTIETYIRLHYNEFHELNDVSADKLWNVMQTILNNSIYLNDKNINIKNTLNNLIMEYPQLLVERIYLSKKTIFKYINSEFDNNTKYSTLVTYTTKSNDTSKSFLLDQQKSVSEQFDQNDWIIVNLKQAGYYRVNYNIENWKNLAYYLYYENVTGIHVLNRAQIIDDAFYFFMQRQLTYNMFWNITSFLCNDTDYIAWYPMIKAIEHMTCIWPVQSVTRLKNTLKEMFHKLLLNIDYDENSYENDLTKCLREEAIKWACILDDPKCKEVSVDILQIHFKRSKQLNEPVYLKGKESMYCRGIMYGNYGDWLNVQGLSETITQINTQDTLTKLYSLICSPDPVVMRAYLQITMKNECAVREKTSRKMCANIILLIAARHAKHDIVLNEIFDTLQSIKFSSKKETDDIAILIVIITHEHNAEQFSKITEFVKNNMTMSDRLVYAVEQRIKKRQEEYARKITKYLEIFR